MLSLWMEIEVEWNECNQMEWKLKLKLKWKEKK